MLKEFLKNAKDDAPVYINHVRDRFSELKEGEREEVILAVKSIAGDGEKTFSIMLPSLEGCLEEETGFIKTYLNAEIYNILSALGGKYITCYADTRNEKLYRMLQSLDETFGINQKRSEREGFGKCINVIDRMIAGIEGGANSQERGFHFVITDKKLLPLESSQGRAQKTQKVNKTREKQNDTFHEAHKGLDGKVLCGIDIGGTDIKAVLAMDGILKYIKEYDWFPSVYQTADEIMEPIVDLVRLLAVKASLDKMTDEERKTPKYIKLGADLDAAMGKAATGEFIREVSLSAEAALGGKLIYIDAIGMCFPDVVVRDRIIGGETYKTRGIRNNPNVDYEVEFAKFLSLNEELKKYSGVVRNTNDGPMAAFTAAVEMAASGKELELDKGIFAHTLGTELGTGWVDEEGLIPEIPLEIYNFIIDLGSFVQKGFEPDDIRSINNFNTKLAGTLQKYASQSGAFRLAAKYFPEKRPDLFSEIEQRGFITYKDSENGKGIYLELEKRDMRKPFLEYLMELTETEHDANVSDEENVTRKLWMDIGEYLAVTWCETDRILVPEAKARILFGRLVKNKTCFELIKKGAERIKPGLVLEVADETMSYSALMKQLEQNKEYTVAQFAQAVGAIYYGKAALKMAEL